jgi:hypothetical protein
MLKEIFWLLNTKELDSRETEELAAIETKLRNGLNLTITESAFVQTTFFKYKRY